MSVDVPGQKLGKLAPKFLRGLPVIDHYTVALPAPPLAVKYSDALHHIGLMANDRIGDCTCAAVGHIIQTWTAVASQEVVLPDSAIIDMYSDITGYVLGDASTDNGAVASEVLAYWYQNPPETHALAAFASIRPGNRTSFRDSIYLFGACYLGVQLPLTAQKGDWILPDNQPLTGNWERGSWGGHAIPAIDYDADTLTVISWGKLVKVGWSWLDAYCDEAYAVIGRDWINAAGTSAPGFDYLALQADMNALRESP